MENELKQHEYEPEVNSRFQIELLDEEGEEFFPKYLVCGLSDNRYTVQVQTYFAVGVGDYEKLLNEDSIETINLFWLDPAGSKTHSLTYEDVELESWTFNDLYWQEDEDTEEVVKFTLTFAFSNKELNGAYD